MNALSSDSFPPPGRGLAGLAPGRVVPRQRWALLSRNATIALTVVLLHLGFLWALQSGLLMRAVQAVVPVEIIAEFVEPAPPRPKAAPKPLPAPPAPAKRAEKAAAPVKAATSTPSPAPTPARTPTPLPLAVPDAAPNAPTGATVAAAAPAAAPAGPAANIGAESASAGAAVQLPSSDPDYLQNAKPAYPGMSRRLNEQGRSVVKVLVGPDGVPQRAELAQTSGFERLDKAALSTVMIWRYRPGKRGGVAEAMWTTVPIIWSLSD